MWPWRSMAASGSSSTGQEAYRAQRPGGGGVPGSRGAFDPHPEGRRDLHLDPGTEAAARTEEGVPEVGTAAPDEEDLGLAPARAAPQEASRQDPAPVEDEEVPGAEEVRKIAEGPVSRDRRWRGRGPGVATPPGPAGAPGQSSSGGRS